MAALFYTRHSKAIQYWTDGRSGPWKRRIDCRRVRAWTPSGWPRCTGYTGRNLTGTMLACPTLFHSQRKTSPVAAYTEFSRFQLPKRICISYKAHRRGDQDGETLIPLQSSLIRYGLEIDSWRSDLARVGTFSRMICSGIQLSLEGKEGEGKRPFLRQERKSRTSRALQKSTGL